MKIWLLTLSLLSFNLLWAKEHTGIVQKIDLSAMARDGEGVLDVRLPEGKMVQILIKSCEGPCDRSVVDHLFTLKKKDRIRIKEEILPGKRVYKLLPPKK